MLSALLLPSTACLRTKTVYLKAPTCLVTESPKKPSLTWTAGSDLVSLTVENARLLTLYLLEVQEWINDVEDLCGEKE